MSIERRCVTILKDKLFKLKPVKYIESRITKDYGAEICKAVHKSTYLYYKKYYKEADFRNSKAVQIHMTNNILPILSYYKALQREGINKTMAYDTLNHALSTYARKESVTMKRFRNLPFFLFRCFAKFMMFNNYPPAGWETAWNRDDKEEISFDITRCVYFNTFKKYGAPELTVICCNMDDIVYGQFYPKIQFYRTKTLAKGGSCCNFRLINLRQKSEIY